MSLGLGIASLRQGNITTAIARFEQAVTVAEEVRARHLLFFTTLTLAPAYTLAGRSAEAYRLLRPLVEQAEAEGRIANLSLAFTELGEAILAGGHRQEARDHGERALELARMYKERGNEAYALHCLGTMAAHSDWLDMEQAVAFYQQALTLADELGMRPLQAHCHRGLGTLYSQTGQTEPARAELTAAVNMYRDMEMRFWLPETEATLAKTI